MTEIKHALYVLKEPRGFIKFIQIFMAILAFATTAGYYGHIIFKLTCKDTTTHQIQYNFSFPFGTGNTLVLPCLAKNDTHKLLTPYGGLKSSSEFYVFIGVMTMLYCIAMLIIYCVFDYVYREKIIVPNIDFIMTAATSLFWFISSTAWADGVVKLKGYTSITTFFEEMPSDFCNVEKSPCDGVQEANFAGLDISLICGFTNFALWAVSLWFLWKETSWCSKNQPNPAATTGGPSPYAYPPPSTVETSPPVDQDHSEIYDSPADPNVESSNARF